MNIQIKQMTAFKPNSKLTQHMVVLLTASDNVLKTNENALKILPKFIQTNLAGLVKQKVFLAQDNESQSVFSPDDHLFVHFLGCGEKSTGFQLASNASRLVHQVCTQYHAQAVQISFVNIGAASAELIQHIPQKMYEAGYVYEMPGEVKNSPLFNEYQAKRLKMSQLSLVLALPKAPTKKEVSTFEQSLAIAKGVALTRQLGDTPANYATPEFLAKTAVKLGKDYRLTVKIHDEKSIALLKMNSFLSVAKGSDVPPRFIELHYQGAGAKDAPICVVGKGITFDSGGISIKPAAGMEEMKYDMCGAASVLGLFKVLGESKPKINVIGLIPACENMPSGSANKPGDVVTSMSGLTIEVINTDAEGRLVLCDALTYAERFNPKYVVDIATLTGACVVALGNVHTGLFANDDGLADCLLEAGRKQKDTAWKMPMDAAYHDQLKCNSADLANVGGMPAGSVTAACFLSRFAEKYRWAHLDIAGTAWKKSPKQGTGRSVPLLSQFIFDQV